MRKPILALLAVAALALAAVVTLNSDPAPAEGAPADFAIVYVRGGGLAPSGSKLVVRPGRRAVAETSGSRAGERTVRFQISRARVVALERRLARADFGSIGNPGPTNCADCFYYSISYRGHRVEFDQSQVPEGLDSVVAELESIVTAHAIPPNA